MIWNNCLTRIAELYSACHCSRSPWWHGSAEEDGDSAGVSGWSSFGNGCHKCLG